MRTLPTRAALLVVLGALLGLLGPGAGAAAAQSGGGGDAGFVDVVEVDGLLDPVLVDFVERSIAGAERGGARALVLQLDSPGAVVPDQRVAELAFRIAKADVPVGIWVGPSGAEALGAAAQLVGAAPFAGMAPGSTLGRTGDPLFPEAGFGRPFGEATGRLRTGTVGAAEAERLGIVDAPAPVVGDFVVNLPDVESRVVERGDERRREPVTVVRFGQLPLLSQLMHTVASPAVAYLLLTIGLALLVFEFFTAGIGIAGITGAGCLVLAAYGLAVLPVTALGLGLVLFAMFGFAVDVQTGVPRVWSAVATVAFAVGSLTLFDGVTLPWLPLVVGVLGLVLAMLAGMPAMVRTRFSTPTIGREWMIGELGEAVAGVTPDGVVRVRDALWRARTNRATPIPEGRAVRVVGIEGMVLEVEPEEGGARDYRERRGPT